MEQEGDNELKFLHDLDIGYENLQKKFQVSTIFGCRFIAHFSKVPKLEAVQYLFCSFFDLEPTRKKIRKFPSVKLLCQPLRTAVQIFIRFK